MKKISIQLNVPAIEKEQKKLGIVTDTELAARIGVSTSQIRRAKLPIDDPRHNAPGTSFIAGVLNAFGGPFEKYFFLDKVVRGRNTSKQAPHA